MVENNFFDDRRRRLAEGNRKRVAFIDKVLSHEEMRVVRERSDLIYVAALENLISKNIGKAKWVDKHYRAVDLLDYNTVQQNWLVDEAYLIGTALGREPTPREIMLDFIKNNNGLRFKLFYFFKYPDRMVGIV